MAFNFRALQKLAPDERIKALHRLQDELRKLMEQRKKEIEESQREVSDAEELLARAEEELAVLLKVVPKTKEVKIEELFEKKPKGRQAREEPKEELDLRRAQSLEEELAAAKPARAEARAEAEKPYERREAYENKEPYERKPYEEGKPGEQYRHVKELGEERAPQGAYKKRRLSPHEL